MGKKHREIRKSIKGKLRYLNPWRQNEFGELVRKMSKSEARKVLLTRILIRNKAELEIISRAQKRAIEDIQAMEDERIFGMLGQCAMQGAQ